jgi:hypothetical protein
MNSKSVSLLIVILLLGSLTMWAEPLPDAPSAQPSSHNRAEQAAPPAAGSVMARAMSPRSEKPVADRTYYLVNGTMFAVGIANVELAHQCVVQHDCTLSQLPTTSRIGMYAMALPANLFTSAVSYKLKQKGYRWWFVPPALVTAAQIYSAGHMVRRMHQ